MNTMNCQITGVDNDRARTMPCQLHEVSHLLPEFLGFDWIIITVEGETWVNNSAGYATELWKFELDSYMESV